MANKNSVWSMGPNVKFVKCEVHDETNVGSRCDPKMCILEFCEVV